MLFSRTYFKTAEGACFGIQFLKNDIQWQTGYLTLKIYTEELTIYLRSKFCFVFFLLCLHFHFLAGKSNEASKGSNRIFTE